MSKSTTSRSATKSDVDFVKELSDARQRLLELGRFVVEYRLPQHEIEAISQSVAPCQSKTVNTLVGIRLVSHPYIRVAIFNDDTWSPLLDGTYEYDNSVLFPLSMWGVNYDY